MAATNEQDLRLRVLNSLLTTPHRELSKIWPVHRDMVNQDPRFYVRLAAWYADHGDVRDHKEMREKVAQGARSARARAANPQAATKTVVESFGLFKNPPRSLKTEVERYL